MYVGGDSRADEADFWPDVEYDADDQLVPFGLANNPSIALRMYNSDGRCNIRTS